MCRIGTACAISSTCLNELSYDLCTCHSASMVNRINFLQTNSFQGVVVTDGQQTFVVFTYNCNMLQWSGRPSAEAVIGVNVGVGIEGNFPPFQNQPLSGRSEVPTVACLNIDRGIVWTDVVFKIGDVSQNELDRNRAECVAIYVQDIQQFGLEVSPAPQPCPCTIFQAVRDRRFTVNFSPDRFRSFFSDRPSVCFFQLFGLREVQECCYSITFDSS